MRTYSFSLVNARLAYLLSITRVDGTVIRVTNYGRSLTILGHTWYPEPGLEIGDITETNKAEPPSLTVKVSTGNLFEMDDIANRLFEGAACILEICNAAVPSTKDEEFVGVMKGDITFDLGGNAQFEIINKFALSRDVFVRKYSIDDDVDFGDPRRSKIPTFPTVDPTSEDLSDVARNDALTLGERRRFRYASAGNPSDYHNVYWEVTTAGTTSGSPPSSPSSTVDATVTDGSVVFTVRNAYARAFTVASIIDERTITISVTESRATDDTWYAPGFIVMRSGVLANRASDTDLWDGTSELRLVVPFADLLEVGDWGEIAPDYDQTLDMAVDKYGSAIGVLADGGANNFRGFPHITGSRTNTTTFVPGTTPDGPPDDPKTDGGGGGGDGGGGSYAAVAVEFLDGST